MEKELRLRCPECGGGVTPDAYYGYLDCRECDKAWLFTDID